MSARSFMGSLLALSAATLLLSGCAQGKRPFLVARVCLTSEKDVDDFRDLVTSTARAERMTFFDRSNDTAAEYKTLGRKAGFVINIGALRPDGAGVTASELGEGYQVGLGFSEGDDLNAGKKFADTFMSEVRRRWRADAFPGSQGVFPSKDCVAQAPGETRPASSPARGADAR
jgi:hypothetical protein